MRALLHLLAIVLALPQVLLCGLVLLLGHMTGGGTLGNLFLRTLEVLDALFTWGGLLALLVLVALMVAAFDARWRRWAAGVVAAIVVASAVLLVVQGLPDWSLLIPGAAALTISAWNAAVPAAGSGASRRLSRGGETPPGQPARTPALH